MSNKTKILNTAGKVFMFSALAVLTASLSFAKAGDKVTLCHNGNTIEVALAAVPAHVPGHAGDYLGPCIAPTVPEFGVLTGVLAALGSAGSYLVLKKRSL